MFYEDSYDEIVGQVGAERLCLAGPANADDTEYCYGQSRVSVLVIGYFEQVTESARACSYCSVSRHR